MEINCPIVSVVMSVYNEQDCVEQSIQSILNQSYKNWELIIVDDGSTDHTLKILDKFKKLDKKIKIHQQTNLGLTRSLNRGIKISKGIYIARQDADDYSFPTRLEKQLRFLEENSNTVLVGCHAIRKYQNNESYFPSYYEKMSKMDISKFNYIPHSSVMFRKSSFIQCGGYDESFTACQDHELWNRMVNLGSLELISEPLIARSVGEKGISKERVFDQVLSSSRIRWRYGKGNKIKILFLIYFFASLRLISQILPISMKNSISKEFLK